MNEKTSYTDRHVEDIGVPYLVSGIEDIHAIVNSLLYQVYFLVYMICIWW